MNEVLCLGYSKLELSKILKYEIQYDYVKPKYCEKAKLCYMVTNTDFIVNIKTDDVHKDIAKDVESRSDTSNQKLNKPLSKERHKKVIGLIKDELDRKIMANFLALRTKKYSYLIDDSSKDKEIK